MKEIKKTSTENAASEVATKAKETTDVATTPLMVATAKTKSGGKELAFFFSPVVTINEKNEVKVEVKSAILHEKNTTAPITAVTEKSLIEAIESTCKELGQDVKEVTITQSTKEFEALIKILEKDDKFYEDESALKNRIEKYVSRSKTFSSKALHTAVTGVATGKKITTELAAFFKEQDFVGKVIAEQKENEKERLKKVRGGADVELSEDDEKELSTLLKSELGFKTMKYMFKKHLLIEGEKGSGKTYTISRLAHLLSLNTVFTAGHESMESIDLLGHLIPASDGSLIWKDGALTQAFRMAQTVPTVLFFDELLRVPQRELNILVGALSPNAQNMYVLRTGRVIGVTEEGVAVEETIEVPTDRLWVVGTTNVGAGYGVDDIEEALADRFRLVRKDTSEEEAESILTQNAKTAGFTGKSVKTLVSKMMKFFVLMKELQKSGDINKIINQRHMSEAVLLSEGKMDIVKQNLADLVLNWIDRDTNGYPMKEQNKIVMKTIAKVFG